MAFLPALAGVFGPMALKALKDNSPAIANLGQSLYALGKPGIKSLLGKARSQLQTPEGRSALLKGASRGYSTLSAASREGAQLLNKAGIIRDSRYRKIDQGLSKFDALAQDSYGKLSKINKRLR